MEYKIAEEYLQEAVRIRNAHLKNISDIKSKEDTIMICKNEIVKFLENITKISEDASNDDEIKKEVNSKLIEMEQHMRKIQNELKPHDELHKQLVKDSNTLFYTISEKYPDITKVELQNQIVEYINGK